MPSAPSAAARFCSAAHKTMPDDPLALPQPDANRAVRRTLVLIALTIIGSLAFHGYDHWQTRKRLEAEWNRLGPLEPSGGSFQRPRLELKVPPFRQADDRWRNDKLGNTPASLAAEGCAVSSAAMVLASYGIDTDPGRLNKLVTEANGYEGQGWLDWDKAAEVTGGIARKVYEDDPSYRLLDGKVSGYGADNLRGTAPSNLPLAGATVEVYATHAATGERIGAAVHRKSVGPDGRWGPFISDSHAHYEVVIAAPGYATTHIYRSPLAAFVA